MTDVAPYDFEDLLINRAFSRIHPSYQALIDVTNPPNAAGVAGIKGDAVDVLGLGAEGHVDAANGGTAWSTANYFATTAGSNSGASIPKRKVSFDLATESIIIAFRVKAAAPASSVPLMGNCDGTLPGVYVSARSNGKLRAVVVGSVSSTGAIIADSTATVFDSTDHDVLIAIDGLKGNVFTYIDGVLDSFYRACFVGSTSSNTNNWRLGYAYVTGTSVAFAFSGYFHFLKFTGSLPFGLSPAAKKLDAAPTAILTGADFRSPVKSMVVSIIGQSNEWGAGAEPSASGPFATPQYDPLPAVTGRAGGTHSMWPALATMLARRGVDAQFYNTAIGSTSIIHSWAGVLRAWSSGMLTTRGTYVLSSGNVYKCTTGSRTSPTVVAATVQPTGTSATQTGADSVTWTYMAAARAQDVAGYIYPYTDAYFDPNLNIVDALTALTNHPGFDEKWMFLSIGQGDKTMGTLRAEFALGYQRVADYFLANSVKVALGFTCAGTTAGLETWYQSDLLPGYADALAYYAGNANVVAGANLRTALGALTVVATGDLIGLQSDQLHMNDPTLTMGAEAWRDALVTAGVVGEIVAP